MPNFPAPRMNWADTIDQNHSLPVGGTASYCHAHKVFHAQCVESLSTIDVRQPHTSSRSTIFQRVFLGPKLWALSAFFVFYTWLSVNESSSPPNPGFSTSINQTQHQLRVKVEAYRAEMDTRLLVAYSNTSETQITGISWECEKEVCVMDNMINTIDDVLTNTRQIEADIQKLAKTSVAILKRAAAAVSRSIDYDVRCFGESDAHPDLVEHLKFVFITFNITWTDNLLSRAVLMLNISGDSLKERISALKRTQKEEFSASVSWKQIFRAMNPSRVQRARLHEQRYRTQVKLLQDVLDSTTELRSRVHGLHRHLTDWHWTRDETLRKLVALADITASNQLKSSASIVGETITAIYTSDNRAAFRAWYGIESIVWKVEPSLSGESQRSNSNRLLNEGRDYQGH